MLSGFYTLTAFFSPMLYSGIKTGIYMITPRSLSSILLNLHFNMCLFAGNSNLTQKVKN